ncbi:hypothetical protein V8E54_003087 [Elaphomyces granulatus]
MSKAFLRPWCYACRTDIFQSFVSISGISLCRPPSLLFPFRGLPRKHFSTELQLRVDNNPIPPSNAGFDEPLTTRNNENADDDLSKSLQHRPWYLQVGTAAGPSHPLADRQQVPDLPENPPAILRSLLQHLSLEIGLNDLTLLDLRGRDPPPALGGNVIMIIGTARGLKHLSVSSDRLCRWLRKFELRPYADGSLGRRELRLKRRRESRRAKLASMAGVRYAQKDDDSPNGWICVNVGIVEHEDESVQVEKLRERGFEGFGKGDGGTRIVVQMFVEEKRAEIDLEGLWGTNPNQEDRGHVVGV